MILPGAYPAFAARGRVDPAPMAPLVALRERLTVLVFGRSLYCPLCVAVAARGRRRVAMAGDMHPSTHVLPTTPPSHAAPPRPARARARREPGPRTDRQPVSQRVSEVRAYYRRIAPYLDLELADRGDRGFWEWAASEPAGCRVLELGAGTGRATRFLARTAARVFACDLSPELIAIARERLGDLENVRLFVADMRRLCLAARFDLVVAVDDPFAHLLLGGERDRALRAAAAHLAPGGRLVLDAAWFSPHRRELSSRPEGLVSERFRGGGAGQLRVREEV